MARKCVKLILLLCLILLPLQYDFAQSKLTFDIIIRGLEKDKDAHDNAKARILVLESKSGPLTPHVIRLLYRQGSKEIKNGIAPYGYLRARVTPSRLVHRGNQWKAVYCVRPGPLLHVTAVSISVIGLGSYNPAIQKYIYKHRIKPGEPFNIPRYETFKKDLFEIAKNQGYLRATFNNKIIIDPIPYTSRMIIILATGPQYYFGSVTFKTSPYSTAFMERFINFKPGDVYSSDKILSLQQAMEKSYYFDRVAFKPDFDHSQDLIVPVDAYLYPPSAKTYSFGVGYGTLTGTRLTSAVSLRHIGNEGQHIEAEMKLSRVLTGIGATYYIPGKNPLTDEWLMGANYKVFRPSVGRSNTFSLVAGYNKKFPNWQSSINLNAMQEGFEIYGLPPKQSTHALYPSWIACYVLADNMTNPHNAFAVNLTLQAGSQAILSPMNFGQAKTRVKWIVSPFSFGRFIFRVDGGATDTNNLTVFPFSMRYFAGGVNSLRGFADSSIGPGKYLYIGSAEYQQHITGDWYGAIFYDAGNAANHVAGGLNRGAGIGVIYGTQLGPLKIYAARALSKHTHPNSIDFSVGPEFS